jgi:hypothetical protein
MIPESGIERILKKLEVKKPLWKSVASFEFRIKKNRHCAREGCAFRPNDGGEVGAEVVSK